MGMDGTDSNHQYFFSKKGTLQSSTSVSKTEAKKVSPCHKLEIPSETVLHPGCKRTKALELPGSWLEHQHLDQTDIEQACELRLSLADEIAGTVTPNRTTKAEKKRSGISAWCKGNGATYRKLEGLLKRLHGEADKEQAELLQRLWEEVELEKSYFLCHLLNVHGHSLLTEAEKKGKVRKGPAMLRTKETRSNDLQESSKERRQLITYNIPDSKQPSPIKKIKEGSEKEDFNKSLFSSSLLVDKTECDLYRTLPDVDHNWDSSSSLEKSLFKCTEHNMEDTHFSPITASSVGEPEPPAGPEPPEQERTEKEKETSNMENLGHRTITNGNASMLGKRHHSLYLDFKNHEGQGFRKNGTDYEYLVRQNSELLRALEDLEKTVSTLREENSLLVNAPIPLKPGTVEQYKRAFARQRARDLAQHADALLSKDKEIAALQNECRQLEARLGQDKQGTPSPAGAGEFERLLRESQKEVLRLQRQLSVSSFSARDQSSAEKEREQNETPVVCEASHHVVNEPCVNRKETHEEEEAESGVTAEQNSSSIQPEEQTPKKQIEFLESELSKKRKECEGLEHEVRKRQKRCLDLSQVENEELKEELTALSAQYSSVLEENQRLRAKLENLEQVLKAKVQELEQKCRNQSEQFSLLSQELDKFRQQASKIDLSSPGLLCSSLTQLPNGLSLPTDTVLILLFSLYPFVSIIDSSGTSASWDDIAFWSLEGNEALCDFSEQGIQGHLAAVLRTGTASYSAGLTHTERSPGTQHRELPGLNLKSASTSSTSPPKSENAKLTPKSAATSCKASPTHEVDTASEVEELDIDASPVPFPASRGAAKLQVFIARYSYNPYDGPNDNPEVELPLTAGEYIYVYGDMDDDGFYEGELMDGRRGLVPSNFVERVSDDDAHEAPDFSHNSLLESSFHSTSERPHLHQHYVRSGHSITDRKEASDTNDISKASTVPLVNGLDMDLDIEDDTEAHVVPHPHKLTFIKQLAKSLVLSWEAPPGATVQGYNVYVDQELRLSVPAGNPTKAVLEKMDLSHKAHRVAVQTVTEHGTSDPLRCCMLVGKDVFPAPTELQVERIMATSARLTWLPSNSTYAHAVCLNGKLRELVQAGRHSLHLTDLIPGVHYRVEVEAQLPSEQRARKCAVTAFTTRTAGPPDAPLDVQLEQGPTLGIAQISWLPVTIDAAGTSNGVRVTGYTIYADKKKMLEVSSPTAGSVLIGPSQIEMLRMAHELTVRTMSPHGESADSRPMNVPAKLPAIMTGASMPPRQSVPTHASVLTTASTKKEPDYCATSLSTAKTPMMPLNSVPHPNPISSIRDVHANTSTEATNDATLPTASYVDQWANPASVVQEAQPLPAASANVQQQTVPAPKVVPTPVPVSEPMSTASVLEPPAQPSVALTSSVEPSRDPESPEPQRILTSVSDFLDDPMPHKSSPTPSMPKVIVPGTELLDVPDTHPLRPPNPSPVESEPEGDRENARLVSIEEFLRPEPVPRTKVYAGGLMDPPPDYHVDSSRSDLSDILEEEEEDLYSESAADATAKDHSSGPTDRPEGWEADSDEDVLEKILKLHPQVLTNKQLFSIPEVTEEEDNSESEPISRLSSTKGHFLCQPVSGRCLPCGDKAKIERNRGTTQARVRPDLNYINTVDTTNCEDIEEVDFDSDSSLYVGPCSREVTPRRLHRVHREQDRLRREALLHSHMSSHLATSGGTAEGPYMLSRTVGHFKTPAVEIDVEYGTDNDAEASQFNPGEVVGQISSEWWVEGGNHDYHHASSSRQSKQDTLIAMSSGHYQWVCYIIICPSTIAPLGINPP
ncbi:Peripheral-type benzodiazepine receptor-associated protein 1 [Bagarius yarrelli]|uniref:Peripheral-type benzodiazepine receptor-associated protein 1 n=1 Tax=Bagarius yarrelli TaxID=175774 RepID=A0A556VB09_BAGYA|nr:Peripheral-type benzodiazepine receptor-associated protein 1 [Bagarius yarrelli]